jgi:hypothetical protein
VQRRGTQNGAATFSYTPTPASYSVGDREWLLSANPIHAGDPRRAWAADDSIVAIPSFTQLRVAASNVCRYKIYLSPLGDRMPGGH